MHKLNAQMVDRNLSRPQWTDTFNAVKTIKYDPPYHDLSFLQFVSNPPPHGPLYKKTIQINA